MATKKKSIPLTDSGIDWNSPVGDFTPIGRDSTAEQVAEEPAPRGTMRALADTGLSFGRGAVQGVRMLTDVAGADNAVSGGLRGVEDFLGGLQSAQAKGDQAEIARILKDAEGQGVLDQVKAGLQAIAVAPGQVLAQAAGTSVPTMLGAAIPGVGPAAVAARFAAPVVAGAAQGVGTIKGSVYDEVKRSAIEAGATPEEAEARAVQAQSYDGPNAGQIALGGGLGAVAGKFGIEGTMSRLVGGAKGAVPGIAGRVAMGAVSEAAPEFAQGAQEKFATNTALTNDGTPTDPWSGVVAGGTMEAAAGGLLGGALGIPKPSAAAEIRAKMVPEIGPMTRGLNAAMETQAQAAEASGIPATGEQVLRGAGIGEGAQEENEAARTAAENPEPAPDPLESRREALTGFLKDKDVREQIRTQLGSQALTEALYYLNASGDQSLPPGTAERMFNMADSIAQSVAKAPIQAESTVKTDETAKTDEIPSAPSDGAMAPVDEPAAVAQRKADRPAAPAVSPIQPDDILTKSGIPFRNMPSAMRALGQAGDGFELARVQGGLVVRKGSSATPSAEQAAAVPDASPTGTDVAQESRASIESAPSGSVRESSGNRPSPSLTNRPQPTTTGPAAIEARPAGTRGTTAADLLPKTGPVAKMAGKAIDPEWSAFTAESGTKGIPRADMPQIKAEHRGAMVQFLKGRGITHEQESEVDAATLKPTQAEFSPGKVAKARGFEGGDRAILVSSDNHVLDGHHQWVAALADKKPVRVIRLDAPIDALLADVKEFPSATTAVGATAPTAAPAAPLSTMSDASMHKQWQDAIARGDRDGALVIANRISAEKKARKAADAAPANDANPAVPTRTEARTEAEPAASQAPAPARRDAAAPARVPAARPAAVEAAGVEPPKASPRATPKQTLADRRAAAKDEQPAPAPKSDKAEIRPYRRADGSIGYEAVPIVPAPAAETTAAPTWRNNSATKVYALMRGDELLVQIRHAGHPTALRPYYFTGGSLIDRVHPEIATRKYARLDDIKAAALDIDAGRNPKNTENLTLFPTIEQLRADLTKIDAEILAESPKKFREGAGDIDGALAHPNVPKGAKVVRTALAERIRAMSGDEKKPAAAPAPAATSTRPVFNGDRQAYFRERIVSFLQPGQYGGRLTADRLAEIGGDPEKAALPPREEIDTAIASLVRAGTIKKVGRSYILAKKDEPAAAAPAPGDEAQQWYEKGLTPVGRTRALEAVGSTMKEAMRWHYLKPDLMQKLDALRLSGWNPDAAQAPKVGDVVKVVGGPLNGTVRTLEGGNDVDGWLVSDTTSGTIRVNKVELQRKAGEKPAAAPKVSANTVFTEDAAAAARARLKAKLGRVQSGLDPETMMDGITLAGYHIEKGARTFAAYARAMADDLGDGVKPYLQSWYMATRADPRAAAFKSDMDKASAVEDLDIDAVLAAPAEDTEAGPVVIPASEEAFAEALVGMAPDSGPDATATSAQNDAKENPDVPDANTNLERDRADAGTGDTPVRTPVQGEGPSDGAGTARNSAGSARRGRPSDQGVPAGGAAAVRELGNQPVRGGNRADRPAEFDAGTADGERSDDPGFPGVQPELIPAAEVAGAAVKRTLDLERRHQQRVADRVAYKAGDLANIRETLPYLLSAQQEDVHKAEQRFAKADGYGILFTNGTGTGKTFTGLGIVKRFERQGKTNTLIVVPDAKIMSDWVDSGKALGLTITPLADTRDAGRGITITTYANLGDNDALANRDWDLVVPDEAHSLKQSSDGKDTLALNKMRAITLHPRGTLERYSMLNRDDIAERTATGEQITANNKQISAADTTEMRRTALQAKNKRLQARHDTLNAKLEAERKRITADVAARQGDKRTRMAALSATPFAYETTVDWAEGYLFDYPDTPPSSAYNAPTAEQAFMIQNFGWSMRTGKLNQPDAKVDRGLMQRQFNTMLKKAGVLSGRMLDVDADYDRKFVLVDSAVGNQIDRAMEFINDQRKAASENDKEAPNGWDMLQGVLNEALYGKLGHLTRRYLLEAIKAKEVVPLIRQHMKLGRKVVVFHDFKKGGAINPFDFQTRTVPSRDASDVLRAMTDEEYAALGLKIDAYNAAAEQFRREFPALSGDKLLSDLLSPVDRFVLEFPGVLLINGDEKPADLLARYKRFNDDSEGPSVALVQSAKNKGWSGHDTTGKHPRVLFNLGLPTQPTMTIQQEGRIYRTGQVSNAMFRYLNTGTNWERWAFAQTIADRASAAENLGSGELARALKDAFISGFEESDTYAPGHDGEGTGGKARDRLANESITEYDRAKTFYFGTQKKNSRTKAQEGADYFATPEPVGLKMVEWLNLRSGEDALEPSGGHGAIARWFGEKTNRTAIEPSDALGSRMAMVFDGKIIRGDFESHNVINKYDGIAMNPPFGTAGRTAIDHLAKAATHLRDGGRIVALIPTGSAADKKFEKWFYEKSQRAVKPLGTIVLDGTSTPIYKGDTVESRASWAPAGIVVGWRDGNPMVKATAPEFRGAGASMVTAQSIKSVQATGSRSEEYSAAEGLHMVADIKMPAVTFERAGTGVMTRIVVLEKSDQAPQEVTRDYTDIDSIGDLFDRLEGLELKPRAKPVEAEAPAAAAPTPPAKAEKAQAQAAGAAQAAETGATVVEHTTAKGKVIKGVIRTDLTKEQAQQVDPYTWKKDGGFFIRLEHLDKLSEKFPPPPIAIDAEGNTPPAAFSRSQPSEEQNALRALSENDDLFALPKSDATTVELIAADIDPEIKVIKRNIPGETRYDLTMPDGNNVRLMVRRPNPYGATLYGYNQVDGQLTDQIDERPGDNPEVVDPETEDVFIDASLLKAGTFGSAAYQIAATLAHNTGRIFIGDPAGLSDEAMVRRPEQMLSSALKFGTTRHLAPHPRQLQGDAKLGIPALKWVYGDDLGNIRRLIDLNVKALENAGYDDDGISFNLETGSFLDSAGQLIDREGVAQYAGLVQQGDDARRRDESRFRAKAGDTAVRPGGRALAGGRTLARGAVLRALLREESREGATGGRRDGLLARLAEFAGNAGPAAESLFYSRNVGDRRASMRVSEITRLVGQITARWANAPEVLIAASMQDPLIPESVRIDASNQQSQGASGNPEGFFHESKVYLLADQLAGDSDVVRVLFHEALGHYGLRGTFGKELGTILDRLAVLNQPKVRAKAKQYGLDYERQGDRRTAAEEVLAEMAQNRPELGWVKRAIAAIRSFLRAHVPGFARMKMTDDEIVRGFIMPARHFVEQGAATPADGDVAFSRSAMKDIDANVRRGEAAMNRAIVEKADQARAMFRSGLGWVDFVWGDTKRGIAHIIDQRMAVDGLSQDDAVRLLTEDIVRTIAEGSEIRRNKFGPSLRVVLEFGGSEAVLVRRNGGNGWLLTGFKVPPGGRVRSATQSQPTQPSPIRSRQEPVAGSDGSVAFSRSPAEVLQGINHESIRNAFLDATTSHGSVNAWAKTVGTQYDKAQRHPKTFGRVFNEVQDYIKDISVFANAAADLAPSILPKLDSWRDVVKRDTSKADLDAVGAVIFQGTLDKELLDRPALLAKGLTEKQADLYDEFRAAVNQSLDDTAKTEIVRLAGSDGDMVRSRVLGARTASRAAEIMSDHLREMGQDDAADMVDAKAEAVDRLKSEGYAPLMRFGQHTVHVHGPLGTEFFGMYESRIEANTMARKLRGDPEFDGMQLEQGVMSQESYKLFAGLSVDSLELFASVAGDTTNPVYQDFLRLTKNNRSALKRLIQRNGTAGFSTDTGRVLASFVTSNSRLASGNLHLGQAKAAANDIPREQGDLKDEAVRLVDYVQNPQEEAQAVRGLLFTTFIGGSVASAMVNMTQPFTMTLPYLSQFGGLAKAGAQLLAAAKIVASGKPTGALARALKRAESDGIVSPQEIHHLQAATTASLGNHPMLKKAAFVWGSMFSLAEQFNRRLSFIAAYQTAADAGMADPFGFAEKAVIETQGLYCVDEETECLTAAGWKRHADLAPGESAFAIDEATGALVESRLLDVHRFKGNLKATEFRNSNGFSMVVTDKHDMLIRSHDSRTNTFGKIRRVNPGDVKAGHHFLRVPLGDATGRTAVYSDDEVCLFAWVAAEGSMYDHRNCTGMRGIQIVQSSSHNPEYVAEIDALLDRLGGHYSRMERAAEGGPKKMVRWKLRKELATKVKKALPDKLVGFDLIADLTVPQMALFLNTFTKGDGHFPEEGGSTVTQKIVGNLDALQAMAVLSGQTSTKYDRMGRHDFGVLYVAKNSKHAHARPMRRTEVSVPLVWCPETEHGTWIARRNGRTFVTGNSKANKPNWARGPIGATAMTFKQFSTHYIEWLTRMYQSGPEGKRAAITALAILMLMGGAGGLPFADDLDDIIDTLAQAMGYDFNSKTAKRKFIAETLGLGDDVAEVATRGITALPGFPMDLSLRMGMGNLLPATGILLRSNTDRSRDLLEVAGAAGGLAKMALDGGQKLLQGDPLGAGKAVVPLAIQNIIKSVGMWDTGEYRNQKGAKVTDVDGIDAGMKSLGFQPAEVARESAKVNAIQRTIQLAKNVETEIAGAMAQARLDGDIEAEQAARQSLADWNRKNPETPIRIRPADIVRRVREMRSSRSDRLVKSAPKELRATVREGIN